MGNSAPPAHQTPAPGLAHQTPAPGLAHQPSMPGRAHQPSMPSLAPQPTLSLWARVSLGVMSLLMLGGILVSLAAFAYGRQAAREAYDRLLLGAANNIAASIGVVDGALAVELPISAFQLLALAPDDRIAYRVTGLDGAVLTGYAVDFPRRRSDAAIEFSDGTFGEDRARFVSIRKRFSERNLSGTVDISIGQTLRARESLALDITRNALIILSIAGIVMMGLAALMVRHAMQPLNDIAQSFAARDPHDLTPMTTPVPFEAVGMILAMNGFMARLDRQVSAMRNLISDTAHQLRTPVAALRAQADLAAVERDEARRAVIVERIHRRSRGLGRLLDQMLSRALVIHRTDSVRPEALDLRDIALEAIEAGDHDLLRPGTEIRLDIGADPVLVLGDALSLSEALKNLLNNALKHGVAPVVVGAERGVVGGEARARLWVQDAGDGPPEAVRQRLTERLGERFARSAVSRGDSAGLGLSIGHAVAVAFGGALMFERTAEGFRATISLPALPAPPEQEHP